MKEQKVIRHNEMLSMLDDLGRALAEQGKVVEVAIYGGAAAMLCFNLREATADLDFLTLAGDDAAIKQSIKEIGEKYNHASDWMNDSVEIFVSQNPEHEFYGDFPRGCNAGLRIVSVSADYFFAMKAMALRTSLETTDAEDVWDMLDLCDVQCIDDALSIIERFYPNGLSSRNKAILHDLIDANRAGKPYCPSYAY